MKKILIIAGGTGGHIFPALAVAHALREEKIDVQWMGTEGGMERTLVSQQFPLFLLPTRALRGKGMWGKIRGFWYLCRSLMLSIRFIHRYQPDVVLGLGGYASGPGGLAAWVLRRPLVIHEQNAIAGWTNRVLSRFAHTVLQAFPGAFPSRIVAKTVGNPVRKALLELPDPSLRFQGRTAPLRILVLGGSQGAHAINACIMNMLPLLPSDLPILIWHQTGSRDHETVQKTYASYGNLSYRVEAFITDMSSAYTWADLAICRSGALTVSELSAVGLGSVLIPFPHAVDDHQRVNAMVLVNGGAAVMILESELTAEKVIAELQVMQNAPNRLLNMAVAARQLTKSDAVLAVVSACKMAEFERKKRVE